MTMMEDRTEVEEEETTTVPNAEEETTEQNETEQVSPFDLSWGAVCDTFKPDLMSAYQGALAAKAAAEDEGFVAAFTAWKESQRLASDTRRVLTALCETGHLSAEDGWKVVLSAEVHAQATERPQALDFDKTTGDTAVTGLRAILAMPSVTVSDEGAAAIEGAIAAWEQVKGTAKVKVPGSGSGSGSGGATTSIPPIEVLYGGVKVGGSGVDASPAWSSCLSNIATKLDDTKVMSRAQFKPMRDDVKDALNRVLADGTRIDLANGFTVRRAV